MFIALVVISSLLITFIFLESFSYTFVRKRSTPTVRFLTEKEELLNDVSDLGDNTKNFFESAKRGLSNFRQGRYRECLNDLNIAAGSNISQPLPQRGILLYCFEDYENSALQLQRDVNLLESSKFFKATELRLWLFAALKKLGKNVEAVAALDLDNKARIPLQYQGSLMNSTILFYHGDKSIEDMLELIGHTDEDDRSGIRYYGNFFLGLYFDAIGEEGFARAFLALPNESDRYKSGEMWYHLPRVLYQQRFNTSTTDYITETGMIL